MEKTFNPSERQKDIYLGGFAGKRSAVPVDFDLLESRARSAMSPEAFAYIAGAAGMEGTMQRNRSDFDAISIVPRMLRDVGHRDTSIELFGRKIPFPLLLGPVGVLEMVHPQGDIAVGRAAAQMQVPYVFSNQASVPMEKVAAEMGDAPHWFQLYWSKSNDLVASFAERAERCGCSAIVVTLDTTLLGWRTRDLDLAYLPFLEGKGIAQYTSDPVFQKLMDEPDANPPNRKVSWATVQGLIRMVNAYPGTGFFAKLKSGRPMKAVSKFVSIYSNPSLSWKELSFLRQRTKLPILLKGILHPDDAQLAVEYGMNGIIVSNHGGRQVDGSISAIHALPGVVDAVKGAIPVLMDSGVRGGADVFKALALGAKAVCIGRPYVYGLAIGGQEGVGEVLKNLVADFDLTMGLAGCKSVSEIGRQCLVGLKQ